jgi:hypothetical protein
VFDFRSDFVRFDLELAEEVGLSLLRGVRHGRGKQGGKDVATCSARSSKSQGT